MATIALETADTVRVVQSIEQDTRPAAEAITAGAIVRDDGNGKFTNANGTTTTEAAVYGVAAQTVIAGEAVTAIAKGVMDGWGSNLPAHGASVFASDTDGRLDSAAGTVSTVIGRVIPGWATPVGTAADKLLQINL